MLNKCCCCVDHRLGVMILAVIYGIFAVVGIIGSIIQLVKEEVALVSGVSSLVSGLILALTCTLLFLGCHKNSRHLFLPWLIIEMMGIFLSYLVAILLLGIGIITLVYSDKIAGDLYVDEEGGVHNGDKYAIIGGLAGLSAIFASIIVIVLTSVGAYLWAVVQHLYIKMGQSHNEGHVLVEAPFNTKYSRA